MRRAIARLWVKIVAARKGGDVAARSLGVAVGSDCRILTQDFGSEPWLVSIGSRVTVSGAVQFLTHDGSGWLYNDERGRRYRYARIEIGDDVFVGNRAIIMPGVQVGNRCVIGAGSVVTRSVPSGTVVAGNPARFITTYDELMERVSTWPAHAEVAGLPLKERVERVVEPGFVKPIAV